MPPFEFLGPYRIGKPLGRGGMGTVYAAVHEKSGQPVAVKLIAAQVADEPRFRRRFDSEVKTLQRLRHPGIVRLIGFGEEDGQLFYSMELVEGESLQARIRRDKKIEWRLTLDIAIQVCAALKHAHDIGVIHRDLKPANLILTQDNHVKLVDFGIAKIFGDGEQTLAGSVLGTADFMAPEQATSTGITQRTDLYALGNVMYAMLTGRPPFTGKKITEVIQSLKRDRPVPLDLVNPDLPEELVDLVHHLLEKDPANRPPTALAVMNRLKAMRAGLERARTVVSGGSGTELITDGEPTIDTGDIGVGLGGEPITSDSDDATKLKRKRPSVSKGGTSKPSATSPSEVTVASGGPGSKTVRPDGSVAEEKVERVAKTHFQTVSDALPAGGVFQDRDAESTTAWTHWLAVGGMIGILVVGGGLLIHAMIPPTADQLYQTAASGDMGAMKTFMRRFPDDPRHQEIFDQHMAAKLRGVLKRLATQAKLGVTPLEAAEEGFVGAMNGREQQPIESMERLQQWLNVYDSFSGERDPDLQELIELAKHERSQLELRAPAIIVDPRAEELIRDIRQSVQQESPELVRRKLTGIIKTFENDDWARPAVEEAQSQLQVLEEFSEPES